MEKQTLRPQWDSRRQQWRIATRTSNGSGGWAVFGNGEAFSTKTEADQKIRYIVKSNPNSYKEG